MSSLLPTSWRPSEDSLPPIEQNRGFPVDPAFAERINRAACTLFQDRAEANNSLHKNFWVMPPAVLSTFALFFADEGKGSSEARKQIAQLLGVDEKTFTAEQWQNNFSNWVADLQERSQGGEEAPFKFASGAAVAVSSGDINPETRKKLESFNLETLRGEVDVINQWASKKTEGFVTEIVKEIDPDQVFATLTAAYVKGIWSYPFQPHRNSKESFENSDGSHVKIHQMNLDSDSFRMGYAPGVSILELPMKGGLSMLFFKEGHRWGEQEEASKIHSFLSNQGPEGFSSWMKNYDDNLRQRNALSIGIPKCSLEDETDFLKELSATPLMSAMKHADWREMSTIQGQAVQIGEMVAKGGLEISEEGAEGAQVIYTPTFTDSCDPYFYIREKFAVAFVDTKNGLLLGLGKFNNLNDSKVEKTEE